MLTELALPYVDTSAAALHWSPEPAATPALDELVLTGAGVRLRLLLLGTSHAALLAAESLGADLAETVACPAHGAPGEPLPRSRTRRVGGLRYSFTSDVERLDPDSFAALAARLRGESRGRPDRLAGVFPGSDDALTVLAGRATARAAAWRTWHLYPNTGEAVRTATEVVW